MLVGANGVGKTNLYRSLELLHAAAKGTLAEEIAREGGLRELADLLAEETGITPREVIRKDGAPGSRGST